MRKQLEYHGLMAKKSCFGQKKKKNYVIDYTGVRLLDSFK